MSNIIKFGIFCTSNMHRGSSLHESLWGVVIVIYEVHILYFTIESRLNLNCLSLWLITSVGVSLTKSMLCTLKISFWLNLKKYKSSFIKCLHFWMQSHLKLISTVKFIWRSLLNSFHFFQLSFILVKMYSIHS